MMWLNASFGRIQDDLGNVKASVADAAAAQKEADQAAAAEAALVRKALVLSLGGKVSKDEIMQMLAAPPKVAAAFYELKPGSYVAGAQNLLLLPDAGHHTIAAQAYLSARLNDEKTTPTEREEIRAAMLVFKPEKAGLPLDFDEPQQVDDTHLEYAPDDGAKGGAYVRGDYEPRESDREP